jgi:hypothetical protein
VDMLIQAIDVWCRQIECRFGYPSLDLVVHGSSLSIMFIRLRFRVECASRSGNQPSRTPDEPSLSL